MKLLACVLILMLGGAAGILALAMVTVGKRADEQTERLVRSAGWQ